MSRQGARERKLDIEQAMERLYHAAEPDPAFVAGLERRLNARRGSEGGTQFFSRVSRVLTTFLKPVGRLMWVGMLALLVGALWVSLRSMGDPVGAPALPGGSPGGLVTGEPEEPEADALGDAPTATLVPPGARTPMPFGTEQAGTVGAVPDEVLPTGTPLMSIEGTRPSPPPAPAGATPTATLVPHDGDIARIMSPNGAWRAIVDRSAGSLVLETRGGERVTLFPVGSTISEARWTPDGRSLLVVQRNWVLPQGTEEATQITAPVTLWQFPVTSDVVGEPRLLFQSPASVDGDGGMPEELFLGNWSPDGRYLLLWYGPLSGSMQSDGLPVVLVDAEEGRSLPLGDSMLLNEKYYSWAPDSTALAVTMGGYRSAQDNKWLDLVELPSADSRTVISETEQVPGIVAWSPAGDLIAYAAAPAESLGSGDNCCPMTFENPAIAARRIYLLDPATGEHRRLDDAESFQDAPVWSEDGSTLYYVQRDGERIVLMEADLLTGEGTPLGIDMPLPDQIGFYGQSEWESLHLQR